jgi:hypothetical protein
VRADDGEFFFLRAFHHALGERAVADGREQCQDVDLHGIQDFNFTIQSSSALSNFEP